METQTFFIYTDHEFHDPPADRADVPLALDSNPDAGIAAWAGALWGEHDLSGRGYCIAWEVRDRSEFDQFLTEHGYVRLDLG